MTVASKAVKSLRAMAGTVVAAKRQAEWRQASRGPSALTVFQRGRATPGLRPWKANELGIGWLPPTELEDNGKEEKPMDSSKVGEAMNLEMGDGGAQQSYADFVFSNESKAAAYAKKHNLGEDLSAVALAVAASPMKKKNGKRTVIFTQGSNSTIVAYDGKVTEYAVEVLPKEMLVDTNGAGDAFVGGFLSQLVHKKDIAECVKAGHWATRQIIQVSGTSLDKACDY